MGFASYADFLQQLNSHRGNVTRHFEQIFAVPEESHTLNAFAWLGQQESPNGSEAEATAAQLVMMGYSSPEKIIQRLQDFYASSRYRQLPGSSKQRLDALISALIEIAAEFPSANVTLERLLQLLESVSRRAAYLALLREHPQALERLAKLASMSQWASEYLSRHPILLDELLNPNDFPIVPDWVAGEGRTDPGIEMVPVARMARISSSKWTCCGIFTTPSIFQLLAKDVEGLLPLETLSDHLTELADLILDRVLHLAWSGLRKQAPA